jgi:hypothetical protein
MTGPDQRFQDLDAALWRRSRLETLASQLWSERSTFDAHWRELAQFFVPTRPRFTETDRNKGDKRNQFIINSTGRYAARTLSSGLHAGLTSPARPWMKLVIPDNDLAQSAGVKAYLHESTRRMLKVFAISNLYNSLPMVYGDLGVFATAAIALLEDTEDVFRAEVYPIGSYALGLDQRGMVNTFVRKFEMTVQQVVEKFGVQRNKAIDWSRISTRVRDAWNRGDRLTPVQVTWMVTPNDMATEQKLGSKYFPYASVHFETGLQEHETAFLRESGYRTFPLMCPRWDVTSSEDIYGRDCPGMTALGDNRQLQIMERQKGKAIAKMVDPPVQGPSSIRTQKTSLIAGDITYVDDADPRGGLRPIHEVRLDLAHLTADIAGVEYRIKRAFYEDLFLMLGSSDPYRGPQPPTAREIEERHEEKLLALGPTLERTADELLDPIVDRVWSLMQQRGLLPEAPPELAGMNIQPEYVSVLAQAQKLADVSSTDRFVQTVAPLVELFPAIRHKVDPMHLVDVYADILGIDPRLVKSTDDAEAAAGQEAQAAQAAQQAEQVATMAKAARDGAAAPMGTDSALDRITQGLVGAGGLT